MNDLKIEITPNVYVNSKLTHKEVIALYKTSHDWIGRVRYIDLTK